MTRRRGPRGDITLPQVVEAAERVLADQGLRGLSLRAVAREAGVSPNAIYTYVEDMDDLRHRVADAFLGRIDLDLLLGDEPSRSFGQFVSHVLDLFRGSPGHVALLTSDRIGGPHALDLNEALLHFFISEVGHRPAHAGACTAMVTEWVHGMLLLEASEAGSRAFQRDLSRIDLRSYPLTASMPEVGAEAGVALLARAVLTAES